jgi:23S rRNA (cytosine1962-C5)-methyltransferase
MPVNPADQAVVAVSRRGAERIRAGHVWVYRSDIVDAKGVPPGAAVTVAEEQGGRGRPPHTRLLGTAFYSTASQIALRMISTHSVRDLGQLLRERIREAIAYRERFVENTNAYRAIFSEGDFLPGLIVDRYNDILSMQVVTQAMDAEHIREVVISELKEKLQPAAIVEKVEARVRQLERLPEKESGLVYEDAGRGRPPLHGQVTTEFQINGVRFLYEAVGGQKTGAFLDQRENYAAAEKYARGEALDVFCYQGGFALHLARACEKVTGVDSSRPALEMAEKNAGLNGREIEWIEANAFDLLRDYSDQSRKYDCIVLDPPAFAKSKRDLSTALRGYKELNLRALKMLRPGGILVTCSCSYHVSALDLLEVVASAAQDSHRIIRILENRGQSKDHPSVLGIPETAYLKCIILLVS